jgi:hypothetical protein
MARRRGNGHDLRRRGPVRDPLPLILVVCEGAVTEPQYIEGFRIAQAPTRSVYTSRHRVAIRWRRWRPP